ncbi:hypothetical protein P43SY_006562 [Pythium insidiosum]|uniref:Tc1-like transposase DDE domain-containing protein n=1 Tax=Pythium insidiosum TaxID=114742 RepID=A0AAD5LQX1_PYTIN|nr:hypothetical protein P43SY_006562 [Pythium insidiosum]
MLISMESYLEEDPTMTLEQIKVNILADHGATLSVSTISRHLIGMTYTVKQVRHEKETMNSIENKIERRVFVEELERYRNEGCVIVYCDETNYNCYIARSVGRAKEGKRAVSVVPTSKGKNLMIQCAVSNGMGLVEVNYVFDKIDMDMNASFLLDTFIAALKWADQQPNYVGKKIVLVIDNAGAHERSEDLVPDRLLEYNPPLPRDRLVILRLGAYSPMCNPIESCFSVLKSQVKSFMSANVHRLRFIPIGGTIEGKKRALLLEAATTHIGCITPTLVVNEEIHCAKWWERAKNMEDMRLGE